MHRWIARAAQGLAGLLLLFMVPSLAAAMERPTQQQLDEYLRDGSLQKRIEQARAFGNHRVRADVAARAAYRLQLQQWQSGLLSAQPALPPAWKGMPTKGNVRVLALLIAFADEAPANAAASIDGKLFGAGEGGDPYESLRNYYRRSSYNQLDLQGATLGWYTTKYPRSAVVDRESVIKEALSSFDATHDFSQYDNDGDGAIDYFIVIWTGRNNGWGNFWWAYQTRFADSLYRIDGKALRDYSWQWESRDGGDVFVPRTVIHETGHALGLPDYYDYAWSLGPRGGLGGLDMMDADEGDHNCFSKFLLDWITPRIVSGGSAEVSLHPSGSSTDAVLFTRGATADAFSEYFMIQNRTRAGNDAPLLGDGFLVWHVDARLNINGTDYQYDNSYTPHKLLKLMEADGREEIEAGGSAGPEDYYASPSSITHWTRPGTARYDGSPSFMQVTNMSPAGESMTARIHEVWDGTPPTGAPTTPLDGGTTTALVAFRWTPGDAADPDTGIGGYELQVGTKPGANNVFDGIVGNALAWSDDNVKEGSTYYARVRAINGAGVPSAWSGTSDGITLSWPELPCATLDNCELTFKTSGDALWQSQGVFAEHGPTAARSGAIGPGQTSSLRAVVTGPGFLTYSAAVTSETCCSELTTSVGGGRSSIGGSGSIPTSSPEWSQGGISVPPGRQVVRWAFSTTALAGAGAGWIDHVEWTPEAAAGGITGTVIDTATSLGLAGLSVQFYSSDGRLAGYASTDTYGQYSRSDLLPGAYWVFVDNALGYTKELFDDVPCPDYNCLFADGTPITVTVGTASSGVDLALAKGGRIAGMVRDASSGAPITNAYVNILDAAGRGVMSLWVDNGGGYLTDSLPPGTYYATSQNYDGYIDELFDNIPCPRGSCSVTGGSPIVVAAGSTTSGISFGLTRGAGISGSVRNESGAPIAGGRVEVFDAGGEPVADGNPDVSGQYSVTGLPPGIYYARTLNGSMYVDKLFDDLPCPGRHCSVLTGRPITVTAETTTSGIDFVLGPGGRIGGRVTDETTGAGLAGVYVQILDAAGNPLSYDYTDGTGHYLAWAVPSGSYHARTYNLSRYPDELFDGIPCPRLACSPSDGTAILVAAGLVTTVDFALLRSPEHYYALVPCRLLDSRLAASSPWTGQPLPGGDERRVIVANSCGIPPTATSIALNVTATEPTAAGHVIVHPGDGPRPSTSAVNFVAGSTRASQVILGLGADGGVRVYSGQRAGASTHVVIDAMGYFE